ncbi:hypothetical protein G9A89_004763 [Geosiphon pyriformis]|nr:hypothetical protein G9A89_004763 [Geosiphon pyriformis]
MERNNLISIFTESKLKGKICSWIVNKFDDVWVFTSGLESGYLGVGVVVVMNSSLARHVCRVSKVSGWLLSIKLLFKNKLSVSILELYAGVFSAVWFSQAGEVNFLIAKAVNESSFIVLSGDFNEDGSHKCASFKKCLDLGLVNSLAGSLASKLPTWANSRGVMKTIDYMFVSPNLVDTIVNYEVLDVNEHFDTDHQAVSMAVDLGGLLDTRLNFLRRQANRDQWKFDFKNADEVKWNSFKGATSANATMFSDEFAASARLSDLDAMWSVVHKIMVLSTSEVFKKKWFKEFNNVFTKDSSRFHKLELLVLKIIKVSRVECAVDFASLMKCWASVDSVNALIIQNLVDSGVKSGHVHSALLGSTKEANIRSAISRRMESFEINKDHMIRSVLERLFHKIVLDHLVIDNKLVLEPDLVKSKVDAIMESWTRKRQVVDNISVDWHHQYQPLKYVFDEAFFGVMCSIGYDEFFRVVSDLPNGKTAGLSAWILMIPKPYEWEDVLTNTCPIALIETARKILSKILSNRIFLACSTFDVLQRDNFLVLKGTTTHWEHLEKSLVRIKMCSKFIRFFGSIHRDHTNQVMTDFGLTSGYHVHDGLDQGEIFSPLLWCIFYDPLLCEVKRQENVCEYRLNSHFVSKNGRSKSQAGFSSFFTVSAFVDNTIWIDSSQMATQHILNVVSKFFCVNDISINNDKTVVISINSRVSNLSLSISSSPISIAKKEESHQYLGIFLSTEGLSKPSLVKAHLDICFFTNLMLRKAVSDKQFLYLVSAVLHPIVSYRTQFSFIPVGMCSKWDALIRKGLKLKSGLPLDFPNNVIQHPLFYGLKSFFQVQSKSKIASLVSFANSSGILGYLFSHRFHDLQVSVFNNFLAGMICVLLGCNVSLSGSLVNSFRFRGGVPMSTVLGELRFSRFLSSLRQYGIAFVDQLHDHHGAVYDWYTFKQWKRLDSCGLFLVLGNSGSLNILESGEYVSVHNCFLATGANSLSVYTDGSLSNLGMDIGLGLGVSVSGLMSSTLAELQAIVLALECVPSSSSVYLFSDSQSALNACRSELGLVCPNFCNQCWVECHYIVNLICSKKLGISFYKVKGHSGIPGNEHVDAIAGATSFSNWYLPPCLSECFLTADGGIVFGNSRHFVCDIYHSVCLVGSLFSKIDWLHSSLIWHLDLHMAAGFTSRPSASVHTYFMKALHHWLPVAIAVLEIVKFVCSLGLAFREGVWSVCAKYCAYMEKNELIPLDGLAIISVHGLASRFSAGVVRLLGITDALGVHFGFCKPYLFFSGLSNLVSVHIAV